MTDHAQIHVDGERNIATCSIHVREMDPTYAKEVYGARQEFVGGYTIVAKKDRFSGWYVHVPLDQHALDNPVVARCQLENAMRSIEFIAGGGTL